MKKLTVIVPVYNTQKQLEKCLNSILNQGYSDLEVIIVNDGSTDNSEEIINRYIEKYSNIKYYKKENTGIADTRNYGIDKATGDYTMFVDSDDYIDIDLLTTLVPYIEENIDIIKFKLRRIKENENVQESVSGATFSIMNGEEGFNKLCFTDVLLDSPCLYLFKTSYLKENNFKFNIQTRYHEDFGLIPLILIKAGSIVSLDYYGYYYVQSINSITRNEDYEKTLIKMHDCFIHYDNMIKKTEEYSLEKLSKENIKTYYTNAIILKLKELKKEDRKEFIKQIRKRKMHDNIKIRNIKQLIKKVVLTFSIELYLNMV